MTYLRKKDQENTAPFVGDLKTGAHETARGQQPPKGFFILPGKLPTHESPMRFTRWRQKVNHRFFTKMCRTIKDNAFLLPCGSSAPANPVLCFQIWGLFPFFISRAYK